MKTAKDSKTPKVGYKNPPMHSRFKPGQSGNPRGRKPKSINADSILAELLDKKITVKVNGQTTRMTRREALAHRIVDGALSGEQRMIEAVFKIDRVQKRPERHVFSPEDEAEIELALRALARKERVHAS